MVSPGAAPAYPFAAAPAPAPKASARTGVIVLAAVVGAVAATAGVLAIVHLGSSDASPGMPSPILIHPLPSAAGLSPGPAMQKANVACCTDRAGTCKSGRACQQPPCETLGEATWRLRVVGGFLRLGGGTTEIQRTWHSSQICVKNTRTLDEECASSHAMWTVGYDDKNKVTATTTDIVQGNLEVRVIDGGIERQPRIRAFGSPVGYKTSALCSKILLHLGQHEPDQGQIAVYLDDP